MNTGQQIDPVQRLLADLSSDDDQLRHSARTAIKRVGRSATPGLIELLSSEKSRMRLEAVNALDGIRDPAAAPALIKTLNDENTGVRWVAANALKSLGLPGLIAVLEALIDPSCSVWQREGAHHVLCGYRSIPVMAKVMAALDGFEPRYDAAIAAEAALLEMDRQARQRRSRAGDGRQIRTH